MLRKEWFWAALGALATLIAVVGGIAKAIGFTAPASQFAALNDVVREHSAHLAKHDETLADHSTQLAVVREDLDLIKGGMEEQLGHPLRKRGK